MRQRSNISSWAAAVFVIEATLMTALSIGAVASALYHLVRWAVG